MMNELKQTLDRVNSIQLTENGATGFSTSGQTLVDLNFSVPSSHNNAGGYLSKFCEAIKEDMVTAVKWLFYLRDVREGLGERDSFVTLFMGLYSYDHDVAIKVLPLIPEYGRWKDVIDLLSIVNDDMELADAIYNLIDKQIKEDCIHMVNGESISLLAKWLPSINASKKSRVVAMRIYRKIGLIARDYRKLLSNLRNYIDVTERKTCGNKWGEIDYNKVSSNANGRYVKAFMKHDPERRQKYLEELAKPTPVGAVMHASVLYPHEVYAKYNETGYHYTFSPVMEDKGIEALWNNLKDMGDTGNTLVICDGSGSMESHIQGSKIMAIDVARALGIYFAERANGEFKNKVIEFSANPQYIDLSNCKTLADKYNTMIQYDDCSNTNLEKVFDLLLWTAVNNKLSQDELPKRLLIVSDMEFDDATTIRGYNGHEYVMSRYQTLFETIRGRWIQAGYKMPEIVFWNVNSRTQTIPVQSNEAGVILVSGYSVNNAKMVLSGEIDPWVALKSVLDSERYSIIDEILSPDGEKKTNKDS